MQTTEKFPEVEPKWDSITNALDPYNTKPSLDPDSQYMVPRPETAELDGVIQNIEEQLGELQACPVLLTLCKFLAILCVCVCVTGGVLRPVVLAGETDSKREGGWTGQECYGNHRQPSQGHAGKHFNRVYMELTFKTSSSTI